MHVGVYNLAIILLPELRTHLHTYYLYLFVDYIMMHAWIISNLVIGMILRQQFELMMTARVFLLLDFSASGA